LLDWLSVLRVDGVTVANPFLGYLIKNEYPQFKLTASAHAFIDTVRQARFWAQEIGADRITLRGANRINRNFHLLKEIRSQVESELQLIANDTCLDDCPFRIYHVNFLSHASQSCHPLRGFGIDWCLINCRQKLLTEPEEFIKAAWIRPEDTGYYEQAGIDNLKVIDRIRDTRRISLILKAYLNGRFDGDLVDFIYADNQLSKKQLIKKSLEFFFRPFQINIFKLKKFRGLFSDSGMRVDNRGLDGFLEHFFNGKCKIDDCGSCKYCSTVAEKVVSINNTADEKFKQRIAEVKEGLTSGEFFRYF
jgi:collagenase-like PrtC family protease